MLNQHPHDYLLFFVNVVREINSMTLLVQVSRLIWHNYFPLCINTAARA